MTEHQRKNQRRESFKRLVQLGLSLVSIILQLAVYYRVWYGYLRFEVWAYTGLRFWKNGNILMLAIYAALLLMFTAMYGGLKIGYYRNTEIIFSQAFAMVFVNVITLLQISLMMLHIVNITYFGIMIGYDLVIIVVWTLIAGHIYSYLFPPKKMLLVYGDRPYEDIVTKFNSRKEKFRIRNTISYREGLEKVFDECSAGYDAVVIWDLPTEDRNKIFKYCYGSSIRVYIMPKITDVLLQGADQMNLFDTPIMLIREYRMTVEERFFKRFFDIFFSLILIVLSSPFMLLTALAVKLYDGGPVLYKQIRCTRNMKKFTILKFRSMRVDAEKDGVARLASKGDDRITPVGKFIRKVRLDELPQLFNILSGEMSFIGPRPERPEIIKQYMELMPEFEFRTKVKAGLAGYAQVYGKYNTTPYDKLKLDLYYIENYSLWMDMRLALLTLKILLTPDSTEGIDSTQITAMKKADQELEEKRRRLDQEKNRKEKDNEE